MTDREFDQHVYNTAIQNVRDIAENFGTSDADENGETCNGCVTCLVTGWLMVRSAADRLSIYRKAAQ